MTRLILSLLIIKNVILHNFSLLASHLKDNGVLLLGRLLKEDEVDILQKAENFSMQINKVTESNNWVSIRLIR